MKLARLITRQMKGELTVTGVGGARFSERVALL